MKVTEITFENTEAYEKAWDIREAMRAVNPMPKPKAAPLVLIALGDEDEELKQQLSDENITYTEIRVSEVLDDRFEPIET